MGSNFFNSFNIYLNILSMQWPRPAFQRANTPLGLVKVGLYIYQLKKMIWAKSPRVLFTLDAT